MPKKLTIQDAQKTAEERDGECLDKKYNKLSEATLTLLPVKLDSSCIASSTLAKMSSSDILFLLIVRFDVTGITPYLYAGLI